MSTESAPKASSQAPEKRGWLSALKQGLVKTRENTVGKILSVVRGRNHLDQDALEEIEESLLLADVGMEITEELIEGLSRTVREKGLASESSVEEFLQDGIVRLLTDVDTAPPPFDAKPWVIVLAGVNGVGKTTTAGKMAHQFAEQRKKVLLAGADTFRAAAGEQLELWARRSNVGLVRHQDAADPASVAFDALQAARAREIDVLLVDTAGRLHTKANLMEELKKICRVMKKQDERMPHEILLVVDATTGQNALQQARAFRDTVGCTGLVITKLDGTAKGGMVLAIQKELRLPVRMIGVGEGLDDLQPFDPRQYAEALFSS